MTTQSVLRGQTPYHRLLRQPDRSWWMPVLGVFTILAGWMAAGIVFGAVQLAIREDPPGTVSWLGLLAANLTLICLIPLSMAVARRLNHQPPGLLSSVAARIRWRPLAWFAVAAIALELVVLLAVKMGRLDLARDASGTARDAVAVIAVTLLTSSLQAAGEEYFFRGYLLQAVGTLTRGPLPAVLVSSLLFAMAHGIWPWDSPALFLDRLAFGLIACYLAIRTGGLEAPIAVHAANNVATFVFAALTNTVGASMKIADAPWPLAAVDIAKFGLFAAIAVWVARRMGLATRTAEPSPR